MSSVRPSSDSSKPDVEILHNPRCSKSRQTLELLESSGIAPRVRFYLDDSPSVEELRGLVARLGIRAVELVRWRDPKAEQLDLTRDDERDDEDWLALLAKHPALIERPIVVVGDRAVLGRPPENVLPLIR